MARANKSKILEAPKPKKPKAAPKKRKPSKVVKKPKITNQEFFEKATKGLHS